MQTIIIVITIIGLGIVLWWQFKKQFRRIEMLNLANAMLQDLCNLKFQSFIYLTYDGKLTSAMENWEKRTNSAGVGYVVYVKIDKRYKFKASLRIYNSDAIDPHKRIASVVMYYSKKQDIIFDKEVTLNNTK